MNTGVGTYSLLQGNFLTQRLNPGQQRVRMLIKQELVRVCNGYLATRGNLETTSLQLVDVVLTMAGGGPGFGTVI